MRTTKKEKMEKVWSLQYSWIYRGKELKERKECAYRDVQRLTTARFQCWGKEATSCSLYLLERNKKGMVMRIRWIREYIMPSYGMVHVCKIRSQFNPAQNVINCVRGATCIS